MSRFRAQSSPNLFFCVQGKKVKQKKTKSDLQNSHMYESLMWPPFTVFSEINLQMAIVSFA